MSKKTYKYNPETLTFEQVSKSCKSKILNFIGILILGFILIILVSFFYSNNFKTLKLNKLEANNIEILEKYKLLNEKISRYEKEISEIAVNDDQIYRPVLEKAPLPADLRNAGTGGSNKYEHLEKYDQAGVVINIGNKLDNLLSQLKVQENSYQEISKLADKKVKYIASKPGIQPISIKDFVRISSYFGYRIDPVTGKYSIHNGIDYPADVNTTIYATGDGKVIRAGYSPYGYGNEIVIQHMGGFTSRYAHLNKIDVKVGEQVKRGQLIGLMGNTGKSTGPHLHYEVRLNGKPLNPRNFYFENLSLEEYEQIVNLSVVNK